jgi:hypothetical protein
LAAAASPVAVASPVVDPFEQFRNAFGIPSSASPTAVASPVADREDDAAAWQRYLRDERWVQGDSRPSIVTWRNTKYWVVRRGTIDDKSHSDVHGHAVVRHCLEVFASKAERDHGAYLTPSPYLVFGLFMKWPRQAVECRMPESTYASKGGNANE